MKRIHEIIHKATTRRISNNATQHYFCLPPRNTKHHDPFDVEGYIDREGLAPSVQCIRDDNTGPHRNFTVDAVELVNIEHELIKVGINLAGIVNWYCVHKLLQDIATSKEQLTVVVTRKGQIGSIWTTNERIRCADTTNTRSRRNTCGCINKDEATSHNRTVRTGI